MSVSSQMTSPTASSGDYYQPSASLSGVVAARLSAMTGASPDTASIASAPQSQHYAVSKVSIIGESDVERPRVQSASRATSAMLGYSMQRPLELQQEHLSRRPRIASIASCSSVSRMSMTGIGGEDPFSMEMDELDQMVTGT